MNAVVGKGSFSDRDRVRVRVRVSIRVSVRVSVSVRVRIRVRVRVRKVGFRIIVRGKVRVSVRVRSRMLRACSGCKVQNQRKGYNQCMSLGLGRRLRGYAYTHRVVRLLRFPSESGIVPRNWLE